MQGKWTGWFSLAALIVVSLFKTTLPGQEAQKSDTAAATDDPRLADLRKRLNSGDARVRGEAVEEVAAMGKDALPLAPLLVELLFDEERVTIGMWTMAIRNHVRNVLVQLGPAAADPVIAGLGHDERLIRMGAAEVLGEMREPRGVEPLVKLLTDADGQVAGEASEALVMIGEPAFEPLIAMLASEDVRRRSIAVGTLGSVLDPRVIPPLAQLLHDPNDDLRKSAVWALQNLLIETPYGTIWRPADQQGESEPAKKARKDAYDARRDLIAREVKNALRAGETTTLLAALEVAARLGGAHAGMKVYAELVRCLSNDDVAVRSKATNALYHIADPAIFPPLILALRDKSADVRAEAANGIRFKASVSGSDDVLVEPLVAALADADARVRRGAAAAVGQINANGRRAAVPALIGLLKDADKEVIKAALQSLAALADPQAGDAVFALLGDPELSTQAAATLAALKDPRSAEPLRAKLAQKEYQTIEALGKMKDRESVEPLIALLDDPKLSIRDAAARALGQIGDRRAVEPLIAALGRERQQIHSIAGALSELLDPRAIEPLVRAIERPENDRFGFQDLLTRNPGQNPASWALQKFGREAIPALAKALSHESDTVREVATYTLYNMGGPVASDPDELKPALDALFLALADRSPTVRYHAAMLLGSRGDARAVDALVEAVAAADEPHFLYVNAANALSRIGDRKSVEPLIAILATGRPKAKATAARALGRLGDQRAVTPLQTAMKDENAEVRADAGQALMTLNTAAALEPTLAQLSDSDGATRSAAAEALGRGGQRQAVEPLARLLEDDDFQVRVAAAIALTRLNDERGVDAIILAIKDPDERRRERAITDVSFARFKHEKLTAPFIESLSDPSIRVRIYAALAAGHLGNQAAIDALMAKTATDRENLRSLLQGLSRSGSDRAIPVLIRHLDDEESGTRTVAAVELGRLGNAKAIEPLIKHVSDSSPSVRIAVVRALGALRATDAVVFLEAALQDEDAGVRTQAEQALSRIKGQ